MMMMKRRRMIIITREWVVTAAHCVCNNRSFIFLGFWEVRRGVGVCLWVSVYGWGCGCGSGFGP